jgi:hexosaminidase
VIATFAKAVGVVLAFAALAKGAEASPDINLIPRPAELMVKGGQISFKSPVVIYCYPASEVVAGIAAELADAIRAVADLEVRVANGQSGPKPGKGIFLALDDQVAQAEGCVLEISEDKVELKARQAIGLFYGVQTLKQLLFHATPRPKKALAVLPCVRVVDYPHFAWRGVHLDVSRHFFPKDFIKKFLDVLTLYKINTFHWHLTDDEGWRIEIKRYPRLTEFGGWREPDKSTDDWLYEPNRSQDMAKRTYGGFYTQADIREVIEYARQRFITIVPEIEMPAHSMAALDSYPELSCTGKPFVPPLRPITDKNEFTDPFCAGNEKSFELLENVLSEVIDLFPGAYIHCGGDEARKTSWRACPKCQARMHALGLKDADELQSYFMKRIQKFVASRHRKMVGWDEILQGGLPAEAVVMNWRGEKGGAEAARQGHDVVMTDWGYVYFGTGRYKKPGKDGESGLTTAMRRIYQYNPQPAALTAEERAHIIGVQGCIWTETVDTPKKAMDCLLPALCPLSELAWIGPQPENWPDFERRLKKHYAFLSARHIEYFGAQSPGLEKSR